MAHLFLHDYDDARILSFCGGTPSIIMTHDDVWGHNKRAIVNYLPKEKDLKLIWESDPKVDRISTVLGSLRGLKLWNTAIRTTAITTQSSRFFAISFMLDTLAMRRSRLRDDARLPARTLLRCAAGTPSACEC